MTIAPVGSGTVSDGPDVGVTVVPRVGEQAASKDAADPAAVMSKNRRRSIWGGTGRRRVALPRGINEL